MNEFNEWVASQGFDPATLTDKQRTSLQAQWRAETSRLAAAPANSTATGATGATAQTTAPPPGQSSSFDEKLKAIEEENARIEYIRTRTTTEMERNLGNTAKLKQLREMCDAAILDKKTDARAFDLALLRADRFSGPIIMPSHQAELSDQVIEAAICKTQGLKSLEKHFSDQVLQTAHTRFRRGIGLQELLLLAAERNSGYRGSARDIESLCRAAFPGGRGAGMGPRMDVGSSTIAVPGIISNVANKFLAAGFLYTEQAWRQIARIRPATDFKQMSTYRLTGNNTFEKIAPGGEIRHGTLSELTYTNQVDTYGKMLGIDRRDIRNDDLGAFTGASDELGRGAGDSLNSIFWAEWLDDSTFFKTDKSNGNYDDGATDSVLSLAGLDNAETILRSQTKPDGTPLGVMPSILLTPAALYNTGLQLMGSQGLVVGTTLASGPQVNVFYGRYRTVSSVYLDASSATAWYLLIDPNNIAAIEVAFLDGIDSPIVETSDFDFDRLGLAMRAYMDWGCNKQEYRAGVKLKGAA